MRNLILIPPSPPQSIIKEIPWLVGDAETINFLSVSIYIHIRITSFYSNFIHLKPIFKTQAVFPYQDHAILSSYAKEDVIIYYGDEPVGIFIVVSGLVHSYYKPSDTTTYVSLLKYYSTFHSTLSTYEQCRVESFFRGHEIEKDFVKILTRILNFPSWLKRTEFSPTTTFS